MEGVGSSTVRQHVKQLRPSAYRSFVLGADVGGTNTNIGVSGVTKKGPRLLLSLHFQSGKLRSLAPAIRETLEYSNEEHCIKVKKACIAAAGPVDAERNRVSLTNVKWNVEAAEIKEKTGLKSVKLINDFEAIGYGINFLESEDVAAVKSGTPQEKAAKAVVGAGTGLGKTALTYDEPLKAYVPAASEGGHSDFPVQDDFELALADHIRKRKKIKRVTYEEVVGARGIESIYLYLRSLDRRRETGYTKLVDASADRVPLISRYRTRDETCGEAFRLYGRYYGRCAKNYVLETLATGGLYIAGGVAPKNKGIFRSKEFLEEFTASDTRAKLLRKIPIYVVTNYDVSLRGAGYAAALD